MNNLTVIWNNIVGNITVTNININNNITVINDNINNNISSINYSTKSVNYSQYANISNLQSLNDTNMILSVGNYSANQANILFNNQSGVLNGKLNITDNLRVTGNLTLSENNSDYPLHYFFGYPDAGSIGSGIIWAERVTSRASLDVNYTGLNVSYPKFTVRLVYSNGSSSYCNIPSSSVIVPLNAHTVYYVDKTCAIQTQSMATFVLNTLSPGGIADFMNVMTDGTQIKVLKGITILQKVEVKLRELTLRTDHLRVISGLTLTTGAWNGFTVSSGEYQYIREIVPTSFRNTSLTGIQVLYHNSSTTFVSSNQTGLNVTHCDNGTAAISCPNPGTDYRRHFIFIVGYNGTDDTSKLHQLLPLSSVTYSSISNCLDTTTYPLTYALPSEYQYSAVKLYAYCARRGDISWVATNFIDLRTTKTGTATVQAETDPIWTSEKSSYVPYSGATTGLNLGAYNLTANYINGNSTWIHQSYPAACPTGSAVTTLGDSVICTDYWVHKNGDTMTGNLNMSSNNITNSDGGITTHNSTCPHMFITSAGGGLYICN
jgi:hypothetical protein